MWYDSQLPSFDRYLLHTSPSDAPRLHPVAMGISTPAESLSDPPVTPRRTPDFPPPDPRCLPQRAPPPNPVTLPEGLVRRR